MITIKIEENNVILKDHYKLIKNTTTTTDIKGKEKKYRSYSCSFPYSFVEMYGNPEGIYFYEYFDKTYVTPKEPSNLYTFKYVKLNNRKNSKQKSSSENQDKNWAKLIRIPKAIMGEMDNSMQLVYTLHCNKKDHITHNYGLLEVNLEPLN